MTVLVVDIEPMDLPAEQEGEEQVGELVGKCHHPADVLPNAGKDEAGEENYKADSEIFVKSYSADSGSLNPVCFDKHSDGNQQ